LYINTATYLISSPEFDKCPKPDKPEFAFIGRSNVGKSSLINMLVNQKNLAKTSGTPGKTQLINHFIVQGTVAKKVENWYLVDLPGYGYAKVAQNDRRRWEQMIENYLRKRPNLINVFVLIDARHPPQNIDIEFVNKLGTWQIPFTIVFTKADKEKPTVVNRNAKAFFEKMKEEWEFLPQQFITSAEKKQGREELLAAIETMMLN
jgi:GTP-binding protein